MRPTAVSALALAALTNLALAQSQALYGIGNGVGDGSSNLIRIVDYANAPVAQDLGETGNQFLDIAIHPSTLEAFGVANDGLYRIDLNDASTEFVGSLGGRNGFNGLDFDSSGQAWGWRNNDNTLYQIDVLTGLATPVGSGNGFRSAGDLAFDTDGTLYGAAQGGSLVRFDTSTGIATLVGSFGIAQPYGLEIDANGVMYVIDARDSNQSNGAKAVLYTVDKTTGATTLVADLTNDGPFGNYGLAFAPTCRADLVPDGILDLADIGAFTSGFLGRDPIADLNNDGIFDLADIGLFIDSFTAGCP